MDEDDAERSALEAIASLIGDLDPGAMVQRFVLVTEVIDGHGDRVMWTFVPPGAKAWDSMGLLAYALTGEAAAT